ncbi:MAG: hypothetical protein L7S70_11705, partial [Pseudomonadales bacterium]|nr:hypothetical protein [Pseudomonadales bacterium]
MARLPRYRPLGAQIPSLPQVDYAGTARAQARVTETISRQLDRMAGVAFREAELQAKIEGAEYGATNAPSAQKLLTAQSDEQREALTPGGTGTVYDRAAREAALRVIGTNLETAARNEIAAVRANAKVDFMPLDQVQNEIDAIINGYSGALYDISPAAAPNLRGTLSSVGNSAAMAHANIMADKAVKDAEFSAVAGMQSIVDGIDSRVIVAAGVSKEALADTIIVERNNILKLADTVDDATALVSMTNNFNKNVDAALVGAVSDWVLKDPIAHSRQFTQGKIEDTAINNIVSVMSDDQRRTAFQASNDAIVGFYSMEAAEDAAASRQRSARVRELSDGLFDMIRTGNINGAQGLIDELSDLDPGKAESYYNALIVDGGVDVAEEITRLNRNALNGTLTEDEIVSAINRRVITRTTAGTFFDRIDSMRSDDHNQAMKLVRNAFGIPEMGLVEINPTGKRADAMRLVGEAESELIIASRAQPGMDKIAWANDFIKRGNVAKRIEQENNAAQNTINRIAEGILQ